MADKEDSRKSKENNALELLVENICKQKFFSITFIYCLFYKTLHIDAMDIGEVL